MWLVDLLGWAYFAAWSVSFYFASYEVYRIKSSAGLSINYVTLNITGYLFYSIFCIVNYIEERRLGLPEAVQMNDCVFAVHALLISFFQIWQIYHYMPRNSKEQNLNSFLPWVVNLGALLWILAVYNVCLGAGHIMDWYTTSDASHYHYNVVEYFGYIKAIVSFFKYVPQVKLNYERQVTVGWSHMNVWLDFTGGLLAFLQQGIQGIDAGNWRIFTHNIPKLFLSIESMAFDSIFLVQHYCLYAENNERYERELEEKAKEMLLGYEDEDEFSSMMKGEAGDSPSRYQSISSDSIRDSATRGNREEAWSQAMLEDGN